MSKTVSRLTAFVSDLIDCDLDLLDTNDEKIKHLEEALITYSSFHTFLTNTWDSYWDGVCPDSDIPALKYLLWKDIIEDESFRWLYNYTQELLNDLKDVTVAAN